MNYRLKRNNGRIWQTTLCSGSRSLCKTDFFNVLANPDSIKSRVPGWSLIAVLAALLILSVMVIGLFKFNHKGELAFYHASQPHNQCRHDAWLVAKGGDPVKVTNQVIEQTIQEVPIFIIQSDEVSYYVVPPKK